MGFVALVVFGAVLFVWFSAVVLGSLPETAARSQVSTAKAYPTKAGYPPSNSVGLFNYGGSGSISIRSVPLAVIDIETTGLDPDRDRIVEIAVCLVEDCEITDEWSSVVNPGRTIGATDIHSITQAQIDAAPPLSDVIGEVLSRFEGAVLVAHNASFEESFLLAEFRRLGIYIPSLAAVCTLDASRLKLRPRNYQLATVCEHLGIDFPDPHSALGDARATAKVLMELMSRGFERQWSIVPKNVPKRNVTSGPYTRATNLRKGTDGWMSSIVSRLPRNHEPLPSSIPDDYLNLVLGVVRSERFTAEEATEIAEVVGANGLGSNQLYALNVQILDSLRSSLPSDGPYSVEDVGYLGRCAKLLGQPHHFAGIATAIQPPPAGSRIWVHPDIAGRFGDRVEDAGFKQAKNVTKTVTFVVVPDDYESSAQIRRALSMNIPLINSATLEAFL